MTDPHLLVTVVEDGAAPHVLVTLAGEIDAAVARLTPAVEEAVGPGLPIEVDCTDVEFMDSTGVGFLARLVRGVRPHPVRVVGASPELRSLLSRLQMDTILDVAL